MTRAAAALACLTLALGCAHTRHPPHPAPDDRGLAYVRPAPVPTPLLTTRIRAIRLSDDDGRRRARITPAEVAGWLAFANQVFRPAGVRFDFDPARDFQDLASSALNGLDDHAEDWPAVRPLANAEASRAPDRLVIFFRWGADETPTGYGFSGADLDFVAIGGWTDSGHCEHDHSEALAHELGHHLGLGHTFPRVFPGEDAAARFLDRQRRDVDAFDGDGLADTAPNPGIRTTECRDVRQLVLAGVTLPLARRNIMSYYDEADSLTATQIERLRWVLAERVAHEMKLPRNTTPHGAVELEALPIVSQAGVRLQEQDMDPFGVGDWSGGEQLFGRATTDAGGTVTVQLKVASTGRYRIDLYATRAPDFGVLEVVLDGRPLGAPYDAWAPTVLPTGALPLGERRLRKGVHTLVFTTRTRNPRSTGLHFGVDAIALWPDEPQS